MNIEITDFNYQNDYYEIKSDNFQNALHSRVIFNLLIFNPALNTNDQITARL